MDTPIAPASCRAGDLVRDNMGLIGLPPDFTAFRLSELGKKLRTVENQPEQLKVLLEQQREHIDRAWTAAADACGSYPTIASDKATHGDKRAKYNFHKVLERNLRISFSQAKLLASHVALNHPTHAHPLLAPQPRGGQ